MYHNYLCLPPCTIFRIGICFLFLSLFSLSACAQVPDTVDANAPGENIYRHFTGTIGHHKAVLDLRYGFHDALNFGGSTCYFTDEGGLNFFLISKPPTILHTEVFRAQVYPENIPLKEVKNVYSIFVQTSRFEFSLSHDSLLGKWYIQNAQEPMIITMTEDVIHAVPLIFQHAGDSAIATGKNNETKKAVASCKGVQPSPKMKEKDAAFINKSVAQFLGGEGKGANDPYDLARAVFQQYFTAFKSALANDEKLDGSSFSGTYTLFPVYNENGLLVLQVGGYQYDFASKEYTDRNRYLCLDVKNKKVLKPGEILLPGNDVLAGILEKAFRKKYQLEPDKKLNELFTTDKMPLTDNIIPVDKGLIFSYYPAKIFRDSEDISELQEMRLFLTYDELNSFLQPDFKARMGLK